MGVHAYTPTLSQLNPGVAPTLAYIPAYTAYTRRLIPTSRSFFNSADT